MIKIVSFKICPFVQRVTAALEAKVVPYEIEYISLSDKPQWFLDLSPAGQVPLLITESGQALFESDAIVEYLDEITAPLIAGVTSERRAVDRAWSYQASKHYLVQCSAMQSKDRETLAERSAKLNKAFERAEKQLDGGPYFNGDQLGNVDIAWLPLLHRAEIIERHSGYDFLSGYPRIKAWQVALMDTGLANRSVSEDFDDAFTAFYLSDRTFLGRASHGVEASMRKAPSGCGTCC